MTAAVSSSRIRLALVLVVCAVLVAAWPHSASVAETNPTRIGITYKSIGLDLPAGQTVGPAPGESWDAYLAGLLQRGQAQLISDAQTVTGDGRPVALMDAGTFIPAPGADGAPGQAWEKSERVSILPHLRSDGSLDLDLDLRVSLRERSDVPLGAETGGQVPSCSSSVRVHLVVAAGEWVGLRGPVAPGVIGETPGADQSAAAPLILVRVDLLPPWPAP